MSRTDFEFKITERALKKDIPILGICGGHQLINVIFGGTLIQHIPDALDSKINHEQTNPRDEASHFCKHKKRHKIIYIVKSEKMYVNSAHHQAVNKIGKKTDSLCFL